jgi:hypothetical protein
MPNDPRELFEVLCFNPFNFLMMSLLVQSIVSS